MLKYFRICVHSYSPKFTQFTKKYAYKEETNGKFKELRRKIHTSFKRS